MPPPNARTTTTHSLTCSTHAELSGLPSSRGAGPSGSGMHAVVEGGSDGTPGRVGGALSGSLLTDSPAAALALGTVLRLFPTAILDSHFPGHATFTLPDTGLVADFLPGLPGAATPAVGAAEWRKGTTPAGGGGSDPATAPSPAAHAPLPISRVFQLMQTHAAEAGIVDWEIGVTTLDTVFQRIVRHYRGAAIGPPLIEPHGSIAKVVEGGAAAAAAAP